MDSRVQMMSEELSRVVNEFKEYTFKFPVITEDCIPMLEDIGNDIYMNNYNNEFETNIYMKVYLDKDSKYRIGVELYINDKLSKSVLEGYIANQSVKQEVTAVELYNFKPGVYGIDSEGARLLLQYPEIKKEMGVEYKIKNCDHNGICVYYIVSNDGERRLSLNPSKIESK